MRILVIFLMVSLVSSCFTRNRPLYDLPVSYDESAPPEWKLGWQHGCETGFSAWGNNWFKSQYKFKQDVTMLKNKYYYKAWNDGLNYCRSYINRSLSGDDKAYEETPALMSTNNLDITKGNRRDETGIMAGGIFGTGARDNKGLFGSMFEVNAPGYGSTEWGSNVDSCDWLNRCGDDKPKDPMDAFLGH